MDQRTPPYSRSIMWPPRYICETLARRAPPFSPSAIPGCGAEVRASLAQSEIVASDQERDHQILSGFDKNETSPLCPSGEPFPGNVRVIRESKHTARTPFSSGGRQSAAGGQMRAFSLGLLQVPQLQKKHWTTCKLWATLCVVIVSYCLGDSNCCVNCSNEGPVCKTLIRVYTYCVIKVILPYYYISNHSNI